VQLFVGRRKIRLGLDPGGLYGRVYGLCGPLWWTSIWAQWVSLVINRLNNWTYSHLRLKRWYDMVGTVLMAQLRALTVNFPFARIQRMIEMQFFFPIFLLSLSNNFICWMDTRCKFTVDVHGCSIWTVSTQISSYFAA
jgi:hypothetical protein